MAIKASALITLSSVTDVASVTRYYLLQSSTLSKPSKPTTKPPSGNWTDTEPTYTAGSTNSLYFTDLTVFSDGTWNYSSVSLSSSYEAAKAAYNKATSAQSTATAAQSTATTAQASIDGLQIGGRNLFTGTKDFSGSDWIDWRIEPWTRTSTPYNGFTVMEYQGTWNGLSQHVTAAANEWFVLSAYIKRDSAATVLFYCEESNRNGTNLTNSVGTDWTRVQMAFQVTTAGTITPRFENSVTGKKLTVCGLKLERGTRATDWTPAPEDVEGEIGYAQETADSAKVTADSTRADFRRIARLDDEGLHVGDNQSSGEVLIDSSSVNVVFNGLRYSKFAANYVQFGNYQLRRSADGGLVFKLG